MEVGSEKKSRKELIDEQTTPEVDAKITEWALKFIKELEVKHNVTVLFAAETGSRGYSTHMRDSDFDIKGFFLSSRDVYTSVMGGPTAIRDDHFKVEVNGNLFEASAFHLSLHENNACEISIVIHD